MSRGLRLPAIPATVILFAWCLFLFNYGIDTGTLYRTEALRAFIGRECLQGSWLVPTLYGEPFLSKPPGTYVAIALASLPFGEVTTVSARIPSVVAATITVFLFFWTLRRVMPERSALVGAMLLPASFAWLEKVPSAEIDMMQLAWVAASLLCFLRALECEKSGGKALRWWVVSLICVAGGFLTKWTAPAFFYVAVVPMLVWRRKLHLLWSGRHLFALAIALAVCGSWAAYVNWKTGGRLVDAFLAEGVQRFRTGRPGKPYPWGESLLYPFEVLGANLPLSLLALFACRPSFMRRQNASTRRLLQLLHCWTWPNLLFWSLPSQHHVRYALPVSPGIAGLGILVLIDWMRLHAQSRAVDSDNAFNAESVTEQSPGLPERSEGYPGLRPNQSQKSGPVSGPSASLRSRDRSGLLPSVDDQPRVHSQSLATLGFDVLPFQGKNPNRVAVAVVLTLVAWTITKVIFVESILPARTAHRHVRETAERLRQLVPPDQTLYLFKLKDEGVMFYYGRAVRRVASIEQPAVPHFAALLIAEWQVLQASGSSAELIAELTDQQGDPIIVVRFP